LSSLSKAKSLRAGFSVGSPGKNCALSSSLVRGENRWAGEHVAED
jgi:hypothetical protein